MRALQFLLCTSLLIYVNFGSIAYAEKPNAITLGSYYIPGLVENSTEGQFVEILNEISQRTDIAFNLSIKPTKRTQKDFRHGAIIGYFPELHEHIPLPLDQVYISEPFWIKRIYVFSQNRAEQITSIEMLHGKRISLVRGYSYGKEITENKHIDITFVDSDLQSIKLLKLNRIDYVLGDEYSTLAAIQEINLESEIFYDLETPLHQLDVFFVFQKNTKGRAIADKVSNAIIDMRNENLLPRRMMK